MGEAVARAISGPALTVISDPDLFIGGTFAPPAMATRRRHIRPDISVPLSMGQEFQLYRLLWSEGLDRMYVMPGLVLNSIQLNATLRQAIRMSAQFTGADIVDVAQMRHLMLNESTNPLTTCWQ